MNREEAIEKAERALNDPIAKGGGVALLELDHLRVLLEALREVDAMTQELTERRAVMPILAKHERELLAERQPDPDTGLVKCGCGGKARVWPSETTKFTHMVTDYEVGCTECAMTTGWVRGKKENAMKVWNKAMGYRESAAQGETPAKPPAQPNDGLDWTR